MVVLGAAIVTRGGKTLLSRQFVAMTKSRVEGLLAAFPKLVAAEKSAHTYVETDSVRYLYQSLEQMYVVLMTNKASNILADLDTLHLMAKLVPEFAYVLDEQSVVASAFDIVMALDECVTMGQKERVTVQQVKHFCSMESHDEQRFREAEAEKLAIAQRIAADERKKIEKKRAEQRRPPMAGMGSGGAMGGMGGGGMGGGGMGGGGMGGGGYEPAAAAAPPAAAASAPSPRRAGGLQLGGGGGAGGGMRLGGGRNYAAALEEEDVPDTSSAAAAAVEADAGAAGAGAAAAAGGAPGHSEPVSVVVRESISLTADNDGGLEQMVVTGELAVTVNDPSAASVQLQLATGQNAGFQMKTHPNMDKTAFGQGVLALRSGRAYPVGAATSVLKWRLATSDDNVVPLRINVWPSTQGGQTTVPIEFEKDCDFPLVDVVISIPVPGRAPVVGEVTGSTDYDLRRGILFWRIPLIDSAAPGTLEFTVPAAPHERFLPVNVEFTSDETFADVRVAGATADGAAVATHSEVSLSTETYVFN